MQKEQRKSRKCKHGAKYHRASDRDCTRDECSLLRARHFAIRFTIENVVEDACRSDDERRARERCDKYRKYGMEIRGKEKSSERRDEVAPDQPGFCQLVIGFYHDRP